MTPQPETSQVPGGTAATSCAPSFPAAAFPSPKAPGAESSLQGHIAAAQWQATFDAVSSAIWLLDAEGRILRANRAARQLFGQDGQEMVGRRCCEVVHGSQERLAQCPTHRLCHSLQRERTELRHGERWLEVTVDPIFDSAGRLSGVVHIVNDITLRKNAEQALRQNRAQLALALEAAQLGTFDWHVPTGAVAWSPRHYWLLGYRPGEIAPSLSAWKERIHAADRALVQERVLAALEAREEYEVEYRVCLPEGQVRWVAAKGRVYFDERGVGVRMLGVTMDITERRQAEQQLRQSRDHLAMALELAQLGTFERNVATGASTWSDQGFRLLGYRPGEVPAGYEAWTERVHPADRKRAQVETELALAGNPEHEVEYRVCWPDGSIHWLADRWRVHFDAAGQPVRLLGVSMEVTARREREEALRKTNEAEHQINAVLEAMVQERAAKLQAMVAELQHLSYAIIHDMRAPLRAICGYAELLQQQCTERLEPQHQEFLHRIGAATTIMDRLITDALNYDKALRQKMDLAPVNPAELLRCILDSYPQFQAYEEQIRLEGAFPQVLANEAGLAQCLAHLLDNALKFIPAKVTPRIRVWAESVAGDEEQGTREREGEGGKPETNGEAKAESAPCVTRQRSGAVRIWVEDNGVGIDKEFQTRIFDLFQRGSNSQEGTGLGLALVRKISEQMGGRVGVESEPGKGSRFWLELQRVPEEERKS